MTQQTPIMLPRKDQIEDTRMASIYEVLGEKRILFLSGPIIGFGLPPHGRSDYFSPEYIMEVMMALSAVSDEPIWLHLNTVGGLVDDGMAIVDAMETCPAPIYTVGRACYSMGAILLAAGEPGHRYLYPRSKVMLHLPFGKMEGDSKEIEIKTKEMNKTKNELVDLLVERGAKKNRKQILADIDREIWFTAPEAVEYGLADTVMTKELTTLMLRGK